MYSVTFHFSWRCNKIRAHVKWKECFNILSSTETLILLNTQLNTRKGRRSEPGLVTHQEAADVEQHSEQKYVQMSSCLL